MLPIECLGRAAFEEKLKTICSLQSILNLLGEILEQVRKLCGEMVVTARRLGLEVNEEETECLVLGRNQGLWLRVVKINWRFFDLAASFTVGTSGDSYDLS